MGETATCATCRFAEPHTGRFYSYMRVCGVRLPPWMPYRHGRNIEAPERMGCDLHQPAPPQPPTPPSTEDEPHQEARERLLEIVPMLRQDPHGSIMWWPGGRSHDAVQFLIDRGYVVAEDASLEQETRYRVSLTDLGLAALPPEEP